MSRFDWPAMMRAGMHGLGLRPNQFWALSPAEFLFLLGKDGGAAPLNRERLLDLAEEFPDQDRMDI